MDINLRTFLYDYKVTCHLGVLTLKANNDPDTALKLFEEAERVFDITVMNVWKRLELEKWKGSQKELSNFVDGEMVYNYMENIYRKYKGSDSEKYMDLLERRKDFKKQFN